MILKKWANCEYNCKIVCLIVGSRYINRQTDIQPVLGILLYQRFGLDDLQRSFPYDSVILWHKNYLLKILKLECSKNIQLRFREGRSLSESCCCYLSSHVNGAGFMHCWCSGSSSFSMAEAD